MITTTPVAAVLAQLQNATCPEDIFGLPNAISATSLKQAYRRLARATHPDSSSLAPYDADEAFALLNKWHAEAKHKLAAGTYGKSLAIQIDTTLHSYVGYKPPVGGELCDVYAVSAENNTNYQLKVVRHARNNDLMEAEARTLSKLSNALAGSKLSAHFPQLYESCKIRDGAGATRQANIFIVEDGFVSLADVVCRYPSGIDSADMAWMFNRVLAALSVTHQNGFVHGGILPTSVWIRPNDHNGQLTNWQYSVEDGDIIKAISPAYRHFYPPEVLAKHAASAATDIYMAALCMLHLLGGDTQTQTLPRAVPKRIRALLRSCLIQSPHRRTNDAGELFETFHEHLFKLYGPPKFRVFHM